MIYFRRLVFGIIWRLLCTWEKEQWTYIGKKRYTYSDTNIPEEGSIDSKFPSCNVWGLDWASSRLRWGSAADVLFSVLWGIKAVKRYPQRVSLCMLALLWKWGEIGRFCGGVFVHQEITSSYPKCWGYSSKYQRYFPKINLHISYHFSEFLQTTLWGEREEKHYLRARTESFQLRTGDKGGRKSRE